METKGMGFYRTSPLDRPPPVRCALPRMLEQMICPAARNGAAHRGIAAFEYPCGFRVGRQSHGKPGRSRLFCLGHRRDPGGGDARYPPLESPRTSMSPSSFSSASDHSLPASTTGGWRKDWLISLPPCLPLSWRLTLRVRRCRRFGWRDLDLRRLRTFARARCNLGVNCAQLVARRLVRLAKLGSSLSPLKAPLGALRAGSGQRGLREHYGNPCNDWPHGSPSSRDAYGSLHKHSHGELLPRWFSWGSPAQRAPFLGRSIDGGC
jgi:hypothetical protein